MENEFAKNGNIGCSVSFLPKFLSMSSEERKALPLSYTKEGKEAIPMDTTKGNNELKLWLKAANEVMNSNGQKQFNDATALQAKGAAALDPFDFKPRFVIKVSGEAEYLYTKAVVETFRDLKLNNLNFITSQEAKPVTQ